MRFNRMRAIVCAALTGTVLASPAFGQGLIYTQDADKINQTPVSTTNPLPITGANGTQAAPLVVTTTNKGGTITLGGTSQTLAVANASRKSLCIENPASATSQGIAAAESIFVNVNSIVAALNSTTSWEFTPGASGCLYPPNQVDQTLWTINAATTGHQYVAKESQ